MQARKIIVITIFLLSAGCQQANSGLPKQTSSPQNQKPILITRQQEQQSGQQEDDFITYEEINSWPVYKNKKYGFEVNHPDSYIVDEQDVARPILKFEGGTITFWVDTKAKKVLGKKMIVDGLQAFESPLIENINGSVKYEFVIKNYDKKGRNLHALFVTESGLPAKVIESRIILSTVKFNINKSKASGSK